MTDTSVLVSALLSSHSGAATARVTGELFSGEVIPLLSKEILREYVEVLRRKELGFSEETVGSLVYVVKKYGGVLAPAPTGEVLPDMKDLSFYEVVSEKGKEEAYLVTGNLKHLPVEPFTVTVREFLDILNGNK